VHEISLDVRAAQQDGNLAANEILRAAALDLVPPDDGVPLAGQCLPVRLPSVEAGQGVRVGSGGGTDGPRAPVGVR